MRLIDAEAFKRQIAAAAVQNGTTEAANKASIMMDLVDNQPTILDIHNVLRELEKRIDTQLKIIVGLNDPVYQYGFSKSMEAYQQCKLILEDLIQEN